MPFIIKPDAGRSMETGLVLCSPDLKYSLASIAVHEAGYSCLNPDGGYKEYGKNNQAWRHLLRRA